RLKPGDFLFLVGDQGRPIKAGVDLPAKAVGNVELVPEPGGIDIKLLGHATADHAGAADAKFLDDSDLGPIGSRHAGGTNTAGAGADDQKIIIKSHRGYAPSSLFADIWALASHKKRPRTRRGPSALRDLRSRCPWRAARRAPWRRIRA